MNLKLRKEVAECVGLWLAEGDKKTISEITFTNSQPELIRFFDKILRGLFKGCIFNIRVYVYSRDKNVKPFLGNCTFNHYIDKRANRPYFIWRLASRRLNRQWVNTANAIVVNQELFAHILRGFFAGEGNIKVASHSSRTIRIAQGQRNNLVEIMLTYFGIQFSYMPRDRSYYITHKFNWDKCASIKIADLHPLKKVKFWKTYMDFREIHYKHNYLKNEIFDLLITPLSSNVLSCKLNRSVARIQDVLIELKKEAMVNSFRVLSKTFWIRKDQDLIIISRLKKRYLDLLNNSSLKTYEFARYFNVCYRSSYNRLKELENLGLVERNKNKEWVIKENNKQLICI